MAYPLFLARLLIRCGVAKHLPAVRRLTDAAFLGHFSDRLLRSPYRELVEWAELQEPPSPGVIDLSSGTPRFDLAPSGSTKLPADRRGWPPPQGLPELRQAVAEKLQGETGSGQGQAEEVLITHGASGGFGVVLDAFVNPGDRVVLFDPGSPLFSIGLRSRGARIRWVPTWMDKGRTRFRMADFASAVRGAKLVVINSPCNPTGGIFTTEDLDQIAWWAHRRDALICSDESLSSFWYEGERSSIRNAPRASARTLALGTISKEYGLASARVGWLTGPPALVRACLVTSVLQTPFVPTVCQQIALSALRQGEAAFAPIRLEFESRRDYAFERLTALGLQPHWPAGAFFFWMPVHWLSMGGREFATRLRQTARVLVTPGDSFGPSGPGHVRISYAVEEGRMREGLGRLAEFVGELVGTPAGQRRLVA